ncbi:uncharacterized protein LOC143215218 [Lasioglossum baleicum]|uniref:uncharacterized protein LOC143215218 n=1 Tax=Lasioglossum baleicum TaxID=434251 RepID=UPI003FCEB433
MSRQPLTRAYQASKALNPPLLDTTLCRHVYSPFSDACVTVSRSHSTNSSLPRFSKRSTIGEGAWELGTGGAYRNPSSRYLSAVSRQGFHCNIGIIDRGTICRQVRIRRGSVALLSKKDS